MMNQIISRINEAIENADTMEIRITVKGDGNCIVTHLIPDTYEIDDNVITVYDGDDFVSINIESVTYIEEENEYFSTSEGSLVGFTFYGQRQ